MHDLLTSTFLPSQTLGRLHDFFFGSWGGWDPDLLIFSGGEGRLKYIIKSKLPSRWGCLGLRGFFGPNCLEGGPFFLNNITTRNLT